MDDFNVRFCFAAAGRGAKGEALLLTHRTLLLQAKRVSENAVSHLMEVELSAFWFK